MTSIDLIYHSGFAWYSDGESHVKGFTHLPGGEYLTGKSLLDYFISSVEIDEFVSRVSEANGMFTVILSGDDYVWMGVDRMRSFPLFYSLPGKSGLQISDSVDKIISSAGEWTMNAPAMSEFLATGYVTGNETLVEDIFQVQASEILEITLGSGLHLKGSIYSSYRTGNINRGTPGELNTHFSSVVQNVFTRLEGSLQGRTAVIALSGGYDSRLIAAMLKKMNCPEIVCFSYGRKGNPDMILAERVAEKLGINFIPIIYTAEMIGGFISDPKFFDYVRFSGNKTSMFFMQEYYAMKYLADNGLVPEDAVFISGHSGDFFGGSQLIRHGLHEGDETFETTSGRLLNVKYAWNKPVGRQKKQMLDRVGHSLAEKDIVPGALPYSIHEDWDLKEKLSKFLINSCNIYASFGYEYRLPLYDYELQDYFRDLPFELKSGKKFYDAYLKKEIFEPLNLNFENELQPGYKIQKRARLKGKIKSILPASVIPTTVSREDPICYYEITQIMQKDLAERGINIKIRGNSYNSLIVQWYIEILKAELDVG